MIVGLLLAISIAVFIASAGLVATSMFGVLQENMITGAVIGAQGIASYAGITLVLSLVAIFFLALILKKPKKNFSEY